MSVGIAWPAAHVRGFDSDTPPTDAQLDAMGAEGITFVGGYPPVLGSNNPGTWPLDRFHAARARGLATIAYVIAPPAPNGDAETLGTMTGYHLRALLDDPAWAAAVTVWAVDIEEDLWSANAWWAVTYAGALHRAQRDAWRLRGGAYGPVACGAELATVPAPARPAFPILADWTPTIDLAHVPGLPDASWAGRRVAQWAGNLTFAGLGVDANVSQFDLHSLTAA